MNQLGRAHLPFFFMVDFEMKRPVLLPLHELEAEGVALSMPGFSTQARPSGDAGPFHFAKAPLSFDRFNKIFEKVQREILNGNSYLLNLTQPTPIQTDLSLERIFCHSDAAFKLRWKEDFVVFSPERFVKIAGRTISAYPMKGTIDATLPDAAARILNNKKEAAEHYTIVDLLRNDLSMVAAKVRVKKFRYLDRVKTNGGALLQVSSKISGQLDTDWQRRVGDLIMTLLPAGSISGAPKRKTVEIILEAEGYGRSYYTGVFGIFDGQRLDSSVMIRFIEKTPTGHIFKSGGGITALSDAAAEYQELIDKVYVPIIGNHTATERPADASALAPNAPG